MARRWIRARWTSFTSGLVRRVFDELKTQNTIEFKADEGKVFKRATEIVKADYQRESELEKEVNAMLDKLEKQNSGEFERVLIPGLRKNTWVYGYDGRQEKVHALMQTLYARNIREKEMDRDLRRTMTRRQ